MADSALVAAIMAALHAKFSAVPATDVNGGMAAIADTMKSFFAPLPTAAAGVVGYWQTISTAIGNPAVLPAGGIYSFLVMGFIAVNSSLQAVLATVDTGGRTIGAATVGWVWVGFYYKITASDPADIDFTKSIYVRHGMLQGDTGGPNTYVVTLGLDPYHAIPGHATFDAVVAYLAAHPEIVPLEEPAPPVAKIDPEMQLASEIMADYIDTQKAMKKWQDRLTELRKG